MFNLLHAELFKIRKTTSFKICFLLTTICAVALGIVSYGVEAGTMEVNVSSISGLSDIFIISVIGSLIIATLIGNDFESKNIHDSISCGRLSIVISKVISCSIVVAAVTLPYVIVSFIGFVSQKPFSEMFSFSSYLSLMVKGKSVTMDFETVLKAIWLLIVSLFLYAARLSVCIPVAFKVRKPVLVTVIGVVFSFVIDMVISTLSKIDFLEQVIKCTPYAYTYLDIDFSAMKLFKIFIISVVFISLMAFISYRLFRRDEIK